MAHFAEFLVSKNGVPGCTIVVIEEKIEALKLNEKVDVLISEPIGTLLVNERMLETYVFARDNFLKPGGKLFPVGIPLTFLDLCHVSDSPLVEFTRRCLQKTSCTRRFCPRPPFGCRKTSTAWTLLAFTTTPSTSTLTRSGFSCWQGGVRTKKCVGGDRLVRSIDFGVQPQHLPNGLCCGERGGAVRYRDAP